MIVEHNYNMAATEQKVIRYYQGKSSKIPYALVFSEDGYLSDASNYAYIAIDTRKLRNDITTAETPQMFDEVVNIITTGSLYDFQEIAFYDYFKVFKKTKDELMHYMVKQNTMSYSLFVEEFGEVGGHDSYKNAQIIFPTKMRQSRKDELISLLTTTDDILQKHGIGYLVENGTIQFDKTSNGTVGQYFISSVKPILKINPRSTKTKSTVHTIIHELGHKLWYEFMDDRDKKEITSIFKKHVVNGSMPTIPDKVVDEITKPNSIYTYVGGEAERKNYNPYEFIKFEHGKITIKSNPYNNNISTINAFPEQLVGEWEVDGKLISMRNMKSDNWVVTSYAKTNEREFFSETFAHYLLGLLNGDPKIWIESFLKKFKNLT